MFYSFHIDARSRHPGKKAWPYWCSAAVRPANSWFGIRLLGVRQKGCERERTTKRRMDLGDQTGILLVPVAIAATLELSPPLAENCKEGFSHPSSTDLTWSVVDHFPAYDHSGHLPAHFLRRLSGCRLMVYPPHFFICRGSFCGHFSPNASREPPSLLFRMVPFLEKFTFRGSSYRCPLFWLTSSDSGSSFPSFFS